MERGGFVYKRANGDILQEKSDVITCVFDVFSCCGALYISSLEY